MASRPVGKYTWLGWYAAKTMLGWRLTMKKVWTTVRSDGAGGRYSDGVRSGGTSMASP